MKIVLAAIVALCLAHTVLAQPSAERREAGIAAALRDLPTVHDVDPDANNNFTTIVTSKGYPCETHYVTTEDGTLVISALANLAHSLRRGVLSGGGACHLPL